MNVFSRAASLPFVEPSFVELKFKVRPAVQVINLNDATPALLSAEPLSGVRGVMPAPLGEELNIERHQVFRLLHLGT